MATKTQSSKPKGGKSKSGKSKAAREPAREPELSMIMQEDFKDLAPPARTGSNMAMNVMIGLLTVSAGILIYMVYFKPKPKETEDTTKETEDTEEKG